MPPELRGGGGGDACTKAGDMWTLGALTWQVLAGPLPQRGITQEAAWSSIVVGRPTFKGKGWADRSPEAADFVSRLLKVHYLSQPRLEREMGCSELATRVPLFNVCYSALPVHNSRSGSMGIYSILGFLD